MIWGMKKMLGVYTEGGKGVIEVGGLPAFFGE